MLLRGNFGFFFPRVMLLYHGTNQSWTAKLLDPEMMLRHQRSQNHVCLIILLPKEITIFFLASVTLVAQPLIIISTMFPYINSSLKYAPVPLFTLHQQEVDWCHFLLVVEVIQKRKIQMAKIWLIHYEQIHQFVHDLSRLAIWVSFRIIISSSCYADNFFFSLLIFLCRVHQNRNPFLVV